MKQNHLQEAETRTNDAIGQDFQRTIPESLGKWRKQLSWHLSVHRLVWLDLFCVGSLTLTLPCAALLAVDPSESPIRLIKTGCPEFVEDCCSLHSFVHVLVPIAV